MGSNARNIQALLPKFSDQDSDIRFMSLVDLCSMLSAVPSAQPIEEAPTAKIFEKLLDLLDDTNGDVQSQALKCIGPLALRAPPDMLCPIIEKLSSLKTTKSLDPSIPATATRTLISALPRPVLGVEQSKPVKEACNAISKVLIPRLLGHIVIPHGIKGLPNPPKGMLDLSAGKGAESDVIDLLHETVNCFGPALQEVEKQALMKRLTEVMDDEHTGSLAKKKAVAAMSVLVVYMSESSLSSFVSEIIASFERTDITANQRRLLILLTGSIARSIPRRFGFYVEKLAPFVLKPLSNDEYQQIPEDDDDYEIIDPAVDGVKESALTTLDDFIASCGDEMRPFTNKAVEAGVLYIQYDPTLTRNEFDEDMNGAGDGEEETAEFGDEDFEEEGTVSDGEDSSWKIRRCATKLISTIISTRGGDDLLEKGILYERVAPILVKCFTEREESVRLEIFATLAALIQKTGGIVSKVDSQIQDLSASTSFQNSSSRKRRRGESDGNVVYDQQPSSSGSMVFPAQVQSPTSGPQADLARLGPSLVKGIVKLLKQSSAATMQAALDLLNTFVLVRHGGLSDYLSQIFDLVIQAVQITTPHNASLSSGVASATGNSLCIEALHLLSSICDTHPSRLIVPFTSKLIPGLVLAVRDKYFKVSVEAINVVESLVRAIITPQSVESESKFKKDLESLFDSVVDRVQTTDIDLEVRQSAIRALGVILARTLAPGSSKLITAPKRRKALDILQERLKNETTRLSSVRAIDSIAIATRTKSDLEPGWVRNVSLELANQLRKTDRALRASSLNALKHLTDNQVIASSLDEVTVQSLVILLVPIVDANLLGLLSTAMNVLTNLAKRSSKSIANAQLNYALCAVVITPLAGHVLESYLALISAIGAQGVGQPLMQALLKDVGVSGDQAVVGSAIGTLLVSGGSSVGVGIDDIIAELRTASDDQRKCLALAILGEASLLLGPTSPLQPQDFLEYFTPDSVTVSRAAAIALGRAGAGNNSVYLPMILSKVKEPGTAQILLLYAIKEVLQYASEHGIDISGYTEAVWTVLVSTTDVEDNRTIQAECVGRLISVEPSKYLPHLQEFLRDAAPPTRGMVIQAVRFALTDADEAFDEVLKPVLAGMLSTMLNDSVIENRRLALITLNSATQNKLALILPHLSQLLPYVIQETTVNPSLVREVQMGPFKHKVDDGLDLRKSAYETLHVLMDTAFHRMKHNDLFDRVIAGLHDEHDIKMLCNMMLAKLAIRDPEETVRRIESIVQCYQAILATKLKESAVKQDIEKAQEARNDVLRVTLQLQGIMQKALGQTQSPVWRAYFEFVSKEYKAQLETAASQLKYQS